ncbi:MAG: hypothetical protein FWJ90_12615 [Actinomadura sp.]
MVALTGIVSAGPADGMPLPPAILAAIVIGERLRATLVDPSTGRTLDTGVFTGAADTAVKLNGKVEPGEGARLVLTDDHGRALLTAGSVPDA